MPLSAQNTILPHLGADLRPEQPERRREMKVTCGPDDGSDAGPWLPARMHVRERDGKGRVDRVRRCCGGQPCRVIGGRDQGSPARIWQSAIAPAPRTGCLARRRRSRGRR